ncbi:hypothetical protein VTK73DRAFT_3367 [Phialemonium thermophilum]|uniref:chitinase n=1 Tax=Phialemonium thermophilum TaxID=223376 RepID=A0ABR3X0G5_9PEZI
MGPDFCSPENCVNSCDAKSECDPAGWGPQYALSESCPLNVCCSQFGFCGTTAEFCGDEVVPNPSCSGNSAEKRTIAYYEGWSVTRSCDVMTPESIPWGAYTHINFAFATIDPNSFVVVPADPNDQDLYYRLTNLKSLVPGLQVWLSIGGWSMNDPDQPTATTFSDLAASPAAQEAFAQSLIQLMTTFGFDGVDIDWEYPVAPERSGRPEDFDNYPRWLSNLRSAFSASGHNFGLSITLPSSFWYLQNFDIVKLEPIVDWFNMMEYDLHGTWDSTDVWIGAFVNAHTNLTEIDQSLKLLWRNNIDPSKVVLGLGFYGRSFALQNPSCTAPGCPFSGGAPAGPCTDSVGTLSFVEIEDIIAGGATVTLDEAAAVKIVTYDGNWVSYDDASTLQKKVEYANSICLGGTMVWAVSLDDSKAPNLITPRDLGCFWTDCGTSLTASCPSGTTELRSISQALADFEKDVSTFLSGDTCNLGADLDALSRRQISGSNSQITTYYMAQKLVTLLYSWDFDSFEIKYIQPYRDIWERIRNQLGSNVPSWDSLASFVARVGDAVDTIAVLAKQLCPTLSTETDKPDIPDCSPETCGGVSCPVSQSRLTERAMADVPRDIMPQNFDTTGVQRSIDFTAPGTFPAGQTAWWMQVKNLDWWQGSNHGVLPGPPPQPPIASSRYLDLIANPGQNVFTGAGPVYGCTVVAVVSNLGAWTGHFWERFFRHDDLFDPNVLQFLNNGNPAEGYDSLAQYLNPSGPFDRRNPLVEFVRIFIMTPLGWTTGDDATTRRPPSIINLPTIRFPDQINQIISRLDDLFTTSLGQNTIGILTVQPYYYDPGVLQWTLVRTVPTPKWRAEINRSPRRDQNPWLGMLTIQRRALNSQTVPPAIRVYIENRVVFEQTYFADTMP